MLKKMRGFESSDEDHLRLAIDWLCRAQDATGCGGIPEYYSIIKGWAPPNLVAAGLIIPTFLGYALWSNTAVYIERAKGMGEWGLLTQLPLGEIAEDAEIDKYPTIFGTGQIMLGWLAIYKELKIEKFLNAAIKVGNRLLSTQDDRPSLSNSGIVRPLLELGKATDDKKYKNAAEKNILYILSSRVSDVPYTLTMTHLIDELLESLSYLPKEAGEKVMNVVLPICEGIMAKYEIKKRHPRSLAGRLPITVNGKRKSSVDYSYPTANAQAAIIFLRLYRITNDARFLNAALKLNDQVKKAQCLKSVDEKMKGGIPGSVPIWGPYFRFSYPSLSAKLFADAIMLQESIMGDIEKA